jgi:alkyl hydroperoxide reductase subunit AhpC
MRINVPRSQNDRRSSNKGDLTMNLSLRKSLLVFALIASGEIANFTVRANAGEPAKTFIFKDIDGKDHGWSPNRKTTTVLVFINTDCPIANSYHPVLAKLVEDLKDKNVDIVLVHANPQLTVKQAREHMREYNIQLPVVLDPNQEIAQTVLARVTPEAFIVDKSGQVQYRGRIDDQHVSFGKKRPKPTRDDLRIAIEEVLAGNPVSEKDTKAVGCLIRYAK